MASNYGLNLSENESRAEGLDIIFVRLKKSPEYLDIKFIILSRVTPKDSGSN
jgi:hypothetical protein